MKDISLEFSKSGFLAFKDNNTIEIFDTYAFYSKKKVEFIRDIEIVLFKRNPF